MQDPGMGKAAGVFVLGGAVALHTPHLGSIKTSSLPLTLSHSATMNPLFILALVGAAGEFRACLRPT